MKIKYLSRELQLDIWNGWECIQSPLTSKPSLPSTSAAEVADFRYKMYYCLNNTIQGRYHIEHQQGMSVIWFEFLEDLVDFKLRFY